MTKRGQTIRQRLGLFTVTITPPQPWTGTTKKKMTNHNCSHFTQTKVEGTLHLFRVIRAPVYAHVTSIVIVQNNELQFSVKSS